MTEAFNPETTYLSLDGAGGVAVHPVDDAFWANIGQNTAIKDYLVGMYSSAGPWPHWEVHPQGAEILVLFEGAMSLILREGEAERRVEAKAGEAILVPQGALHRAISDGPCRFLAITFGAGTEHVAL